MMKRTRRTFDYLNPESWKNILTTGQVASILGVDRQAVKRWADDGRLKVLLKGQHGYRYFKKGQILKLIESSKFTSPVIVKAYQDKLVRKKIKAFKAYLKTQYLTSWDKTDRNFQNNILNWISKQND